MTDDNYRALVARLRAMCGIPEAAADAIEALMARAERAEAALLPFAELATFGEESVDYFIRDEDVCRARAVLAQTETSCE